MIIVSYAPSTFFRSGSKYSASNSGSDTQLSSFDAAAEVSLSSPRSVSFFESTSAEDDVYLVDACFAFLETLRDFYVCTRAGERKNKRNGRVLAKRNASLIF